MEGAALRFSEGAWSDKLFGCCFGPQHVQTLDHEGAADQRPVALDEAEHPFQRGLVLFARLERGLDQTHLFVKTSDQLGAVTAADEQPLGACPEQPAVCAQGGVGRCSVWRR